MLDGKIKARIGFYERIIYRIKNRQFVSDPHGHVGFREIDVDEKEIEKICDGLYDLSESLTELLADGYEDVNNYQDDIHCMIEDLKEYCGISENLYILE